ncbi:transporter substrate-binding domain-containing protein [Streptomyces sp. NPDC002466]|uniref:transporter substrate-binding domain-containing protein n=1 Tax=unclassified Streptomyces TaxID=2593676 RepID=UPI0035E2602B
MGKAGRSREFHGSDAEKALARFLVDVTERAGLGTVARLAERFPRGGSRSTWADYLNGKKVIPQKLLGEVLQELQKRQPDHWNSQLITKANRLWKDAADGITPSGDAGTELLSLHRKLHQTQDALVKVQTVATDSERVIHLLLQFSGQQETRIATLTHEVGQLRDKERAMAAHHLDQARFRLSRIQTELERARSNRYTAEQAQTVLLRERREVLREIEALQRNTPVPDQSDGGTWAPASLPAPVAGSELSDEEIDREMDERLNLVHNRGEEREELLAEVLRQADMATGTAEEGPRTVSGTLVGEGSRYPDTTPPPPLVPASPKGADGLSRTTPDNTATSEDAASPLRRKSRRVAGLLAAALLAPFLVWGTYDFFHGSDDSQEGPGDTSKAFGGQTRLVIGAVDYSWDKESREATITGYNSRVSTMAAKALGKELIHIQTTVENRISKIKAGEVTLVILPIDRSFASEVDFVGPYVNSPTALLTRKGSRPLRKPSELADKKVCAPRYSSLSSALRAFPGVDVTEGTVSGCVDAVREGNADAALSDALTLYGLVGKYKGLTVTGQSLVPGDTHFGFAMVKGHRKECDRLKEVVKKYIESSQWFEDINVLPQVFRTDNWKKYRPTGKQFEDSSCRDELGSDAPP